MAKLYPVDCHGILRENLPGIPKDLPSGNLLHTYWKWWFIVDFPLKIVIFHSYVAISREFRNFSYVFFQTARKRCGCVEMWDVLPILELVEPKELQQQDNWGSLTWELGKKTRLIPTPIHLHTKIPHGGSAVLRCIGRSVGPHRRGSWLGCTWRHCG